MTRRASRAAVFTLIALAGCGGAAAERTVEPFQMSVDGGKVELRLRGVVVEVDPSVHLRHTTVTDARGGTADQTLAGHPFGIDDGVFRIGPTTFGPVAAGDRVHVAASGVTVNGERRGDMPPARDSAGR
ncbi:MAG: hypothetical protein AB7O97_18260 [Planctomycetota bacterium]